MLKPPQAVVFGLFFFALLLPVACGKKEGAPPTSKEQSKKQPALTPPQAKSAGSIFAGRTSSSVKLAGIASKHRPSYGRSG
jgi:hypothetical protein